MSFTANKRLRFANPDLTVVVGEGAGQQTRECYSILLANESEYVDTMLSTNMQERQTLQMSFPEIDPLTWDEMMMCLQPENRPMIDDDCKMAMKLATLYDKYKFVNGLELCNGALSRFFKKESSWSFPDLSTTIKILSFACKLDLECCNRTRIAKLEMKFHVSNVLLHLRKEDIMNLFPLFKKYDTILCKRFCCLLGFEIPDDKRDELLDNPMFAEVMLEKIRSHDLRRQLERAASKLVVRLDMYQGGRLRHTFTFWSPDDCFISDNLSIQWEYDGKRWVFRDGNRIVFSNNPKCTVHSLDNLKGVPPLPPRSGWVDQETGERSTMTIHYDFQSW